MPCLLLAISSLRVRTGLFITESLKSESESCSVMSNSLPPHGLYSHWILQARILEWIAYPCSRGSSQPRDQTHVSCIAGRFFTSWATRDAYWISKASHNVQWIVGTQLVLLNEWTVEVMWDWTSMYWLWEATFPPTWLSRSLLSREAGWRATSIWMPRRQCTHPGSSPEKGGRGMLGIAGEGEGKYSGEEASFRNGGTRENISTWERHSKGTEASKRMERRTRKKL